MWIAFLVVLAYPVLLAVYTLWFLDRAGSRPDEPFGSRLRYLGQDAFSGRAQRGRTEPTPPAALSPVLQGIALLALVAGIVVIFVARALIAPTWLSLLVSVWALHRLFYVRTPADDWALIATGSA